jgi:hypothetical protein
VDLVEFPEAESLRLQERLIGVRDGRSGEDLARDVVGRPGVFAGVAGSEDGATCVAGFEVVQEKCTPLEREGAEHLPRLHRDCRIGGPPGAVNRVGGALDVRERIDSRECCARSPRGAVPPGAARRAASEAAIRARAARFSCLCRARPIALHR